MAGVSNLRALRKKLRSIENLKKITKAMYMVAAAKLRKTQSKLGALKVYEGHLSNITQKVLASVTKPIDKWVREGSARKSCYVVFSSEKGLCGTYNSNIYKFIERNCSAENIDWITCGRKVDVYLRKMRYNIVRTIEAAGELDEGVIFDLSGDLITKFASGEYSRVRVVYTEFKNVVNFKPAVAGILPLSLRSGGSYGVRPIFEPPADALLDELIPYRVGTSLLLCYYQSLVSEHAARMNAMNKASENTEELIKELIIVRNKIRQAAITRELLDIVVGAEALRA